MPLNNFLATHKIPALITTDINTPDFKQSLERLKPDLGVVANFGQVFRSELIAIPKYGLINYHPSLLPCYRGPSPMGHVLLNQDTVSGVTWHRIAPEVDQGDILYQRNYSVKPKDTLSTLEKTSIKLANEMLGPLIEEIANQTIRPKPQKDSLASYYPKLTQADKNNLREMGKLN